MLVGGGGRLETERGIERWLEFERRREAEREREKKRVNEG